MAAAGQVSLKRQQADVRKLISSGREVVVDEASVAKVGLRPPTGWVGADVAIAALFSLTSRGCRHVHCRQRQPHWVGVHLRLTHTVAAPCGLLAAGVARVLREQLQGPVRQCVP